MDNLTYIFKVLSDSSRIRIIKMLQVRSLCVCELSSVLELAYSTVSKHLSILQSAGIIYTEKKGKWSYYHLYHSSDSVYVSSLLSKLRLWLNEDERILSDRKKIENNDINEICGI